MLILIIGDDKMNSNVEILNYIHQNSQMGQDTLKQIINIVDDGNFKDMLEEQFQEYKKIFDITVFKLNSLDKDSKGINPLEKISTYIMINLKTLMDKTPSHISEMLIQGSTMGIIDITKKLKEYKNSDKDILKLGQDLLTLEQQNLEQSKKFL